MASSTSGSPPMIVSGVGVIPPCDARGMDEFSVDDELMFRIHGAIERCGFFVMAVGSTPTVPSWAYTIGLLERGHPELITVGLSAESAHAFLWRAYEDAVKGVPLEVGRAKRRTWGFNEGVDLPVAFVEVPDLQWQPPSTLVNVLLAYYAARGGFLCEPRVAQLVWPDMQGRLPWDSGFDDALRIYQPLLDETLWEPTHGDATCGPECDRWSG